MSCCRSAIDTSTSQVKCTRQISYLRLKSLSAEWNESRIGLDQAGCAVPTTQWQVLQRISKDMLLPCSFRLNAKFTCSSSDGYVSCFPMSSLACAGASHDDSPPCQGSPPPRRRMHTSPQRTRRCMASPGVANQQRVSREALRGSREAVAEAAASSVESPLTSMVNAVLSNRLIISCLFKIMTIVSFGLESCCNMFDDNRQLRLNDTPPA